MSGTAVGTSDHNCKQNKDFALMRFYTLSSVQLLSRVRLLQAHKSQHARPPCPLPTPGIYPNSYPSSQWCHPILCRPLLLLPTIPPVIRIFSNESTLHMRWPKYWSFSFSIIPSKENPRADFLQNGLVGSPCSPRDSQESSPTPQFKSINSSAFSLLHSPTLTSIHDHRKNDSLD